MMGTDSVFLPHILFFIGSALASALIGIPVIRLLKKLHLGQPINEYLPEHKGKEGTPTCGGLIFILPALLVYMAARLYLTFSVHEPAASLYKLDMVVLLAVLNAMIGLADDILKLRKKKNPSLKRFELDNEGLRRYHKLGLQALAAAAVLALGWFSGAVETLFVFGTNAYDIGFWYYVLAFLVILLIENAVNLTDGLDGLAGSISVIVLLFAGLTYLTSGMSLLLLGLGGSVLGFLLFNTYPAKVFMGDFGSLFIGSVLAGFAVFSNRILFVLILTIPFAIEFFSSLLQVLVFKITKKLLKREEGIRILPKAPLHHTFQAIHWSEPVIVSAFDFLTVLCGFGALFIR